MNGLKLRLATPSNSGESHSMAYLGGAIELMRSYRLDSDRIKEEEIMGLHEDFNAILKKEAEDQIMFARVCGGIAGYARFSTVSAARIACIDELFVKPAFRGLGIGKEIVEAVEYLSQRKGNTELQTVASDNSKAFYRKIGFVESPLFKNEMSLSLSKKRKVLH